MTDNNPSSESSDYAAMADYWSTMGDIIDGSGAIKRGGKKYLPKFPHEAEDDYKIRLASAKFTNITTDILETLSAKPFEKTVVVNDSGDLERMLSDIDGEGNSLHVFSASRFYQGVADGITWILIDYPSVDGVMTRQQERESGVRPYWVPVDAKDLIAVYSELINGVDTIVHARIRQDKIVRDGFGERVLERVMVYDREVVTSDTGKPISAKSATFELHEKQKNKDGKFDWVVIQSGALNIKSGIIPLVPFVTGRRKGKSWQIIPPLERVAHLQIKLYQYESGLDHAAALTCFPILAGNGIEPPMENGKAVSVPVGPFSVLFAPPNGDGGSGEWKFIEPTAQSLTFVHDKMVQPTEGQMRELGRQPLTAQSGNITTVTAAFAGDKANTVIEAWVENFRDFLERCLQITAEWSGSDLSPGVEISTDFSLSTKDDDGSGILNDARSRGDLSQATYWHELKRRGVLSPDFDPEQERKNIIDDLPGEPDDEEESAALQPPDLTNTEETDQPA